MTRKKSPMKSLSQALSNIGHRPACKSIAKQSGKNNNWQKDSFDFLDFISHWEKIVGASLSKNTIPLKLRQGTLTILTNHSAFAQQLSLLEQVLIKKITSYYPSLITKVKKLSFQVNSRYFHQNEKVQEEHELKHIHPHSPLFKQWKKEASDMFDDIEDLEIQDSLKSIFIQLREKEERNT